jgi:hypothetical protein
MLMARPERFERPTPWFGQILYPTELRAPKKIYYTNDNLTVSLLVDRTSLLRIKR